jgi:response regulator RpfG family c-di-GMP phosphodiesterase
MSDQPEAPPDFSETTANIAAADAESPKILIVDDDDSVRDVISVLLTEEGYHCGCASGADEALGLMGAGYQLVISDMKMPGHDGLWLLDRIRKEHEDTSVILLTGFGDTEAAVECLRRGAVDYLLKPPRVTDLVRAIERALAKRRVELARRRYQAKLEKRVREKTAELQQALTDVERAYNNTLLALVAALDAREHETSDHSQRVVRYTVAIAQRMGIGGTQLADIARGALMHDIGKIGVPDSILLKPGPLTPAEWDEMRKHPEIGFNILKGISFLSGPAEIVLSHQERVDGKGYPRKLGGGDIPVGARIFMVADTLDAITSDRPYRKAQTFDAARKEIERCAGTQFDKEVVQSFLGIPVEELMDLRKRRDSGDSGLPSM